MKWKTGGRRKKSESLKGGRIKRKTAERRKESESLKEEE
jgi:hypothetical protein